MLRRAAQRPGVERRAATAYHETPRCACDGRVVFGWDEERAEENRRKHGGDFADAVRVPKGKPRTTIRLDDNVLEWFRAQDVAVRR